MFFLSPALEGPTDSRLAISPRGRLWRKGTELGSVNLGDPQGRKRIGTLFLLVEFKGEPLPGKKEEGKGHHWATENGGRK